MVQKFPYRYRVLTLLFFLILITYLDRICISLVGVRIKAEFNLTNTQFGWVLASFALAYAIFEIPSGMLGDRIGQRSVLIRIVLWWSLFTALTGLTTGFISLIIVRFLFGLGEAGAFPNSTAVISRWFPASETGRGISALIVGLNSGSAIAPLIVVPIAVAWGWRATFFVNGFIGLIWGLLFYLWFRNNPSEMKNIDKKESDFIELNRRFTDHRRKFPWRMAFNSRSFLALAGAFFCSQWGLYFFISWMPVYLQEGKHFTENEMKMASFYIFIIGIIVSLSAGFLSDWLVKKRGLRFGRLMMVIITSGLSGLAFFVMGFSSSNWVIIICLFVAYIFLPINGTMLFAICVDIAGDYAGTAGGILNFFGQVGAFLLAIMFGKVVDFTKSFDIPVFVIGTVLLIGCLLWTAVDPRKKLLVEAV